MFRCFLGFKLDSRFILVDFLSLVLVNSLNELLGGSQVFEALQFSARSCTDYRSGTTVLVARQVASLESVGGVAKILRL